jgi:predicted membrane protein
MRNILRNILKNRLALSTVITTLIILVVAVLLAGVVTYFAINVVSTRVQQESLTISQADIWVTSAGATEAAIQVTNTGGRDVVISQIQIEGQPYDLADAKITTGATDPTTPLAYATGLTATGDTSIVLPSGDTSIIQMPTLGSVSINDIGQTIGFTVFTAQAMYYKETNVQVGVPPA